MMKCSVTQLRGELMILISQRVNELVEGEQ